MKMDYPFSGGKRRRQELSSLMIFDPQVTRSVMIGGQRQNICLEAEIWDGLKQVARLQDKTVEVLCEEISSQTPNGMPLVSAIRVFVLNYFIKTSGTAELAS